MLELSLFIIVGIGGLLWGISLVRAIRQQPIKDRVKMYGQR
jgi:hypothetical protein